METIQELRAKVQYKGMPGSPYLQRWPSIYLTYLLIRTGATANNVTVAMFFAGMGSAVAFFAGYFWLGFFLGYLNLILDMCDGEVARYRGTRTLNGGYLDLVNHIITQPLFFLALTYAVAGLPQHVDSVVLVIGVLGAFAMSARRPVGDLHRVLFVRKYVKHPDLFAESGDAGAREQSSARAQAPQTFLGRAAFWFYELHDQLYMTLVFALAYAAETFAPSLAAQSHPLLYGLVIFYGITECSYFAREVYAGFHSIENRVYSLAQRVLSKDGR